MANNPLGQPRTPGINTLGTQGIMKPQPGQPPNPQPQQPQQPPQQNPQQQGMERMRMGK